MLGVVLMNSKTHMVEMEVVSQQLDQYKNNGLKLLDNYLDPLNLFLLWTPLDTFSIVVFVEAFKA